MPEMSNRNLPANRPAPAAASVPKQHVIPVMEEQLTTERRQVKTGSVKIEKRVIREEKAIDLPVTHELVEVQRVRKNQVIQSIPAVRNIGGSIIIPVVEEELVITKRLVLKEEIHLVKRRVTQRTRRKVPLSKEVARVVRLDAAGKILKEISATKRGS
jgi:uncharacterized protein (TIGR02271 family)